MTRWHVHNEPPAETSPDLLQFRRQHFDVPVRKKLLASIESSMKDRWINAHRSCRSTSAYMLAGEGAMLFRAPF
jgi:hypothetical protein